MRGGGKGEEAHTVMFRARAKVIPLREMNAVVPEDEVAELKSPFESINPDFPRSFPSVTTMPRLPMMIPDEILDYYGWVFCQGGFLNLHMTFEQFLSVVAAVSPAALCPEYDAGAPTPAA
jgi:hypothetical protein